MPPLRRALVPALALLLAATLAPGAHATSLTNPWLARRVLDIAHQGGEDEHPSNTMYAFKRSLAQGADMLELDVGVTRDGRVVVMHDTTLDRTTNGHGTVASHTLAQLRRLDGAYWFAGGAGAYRHGRPRTAYRFRGIATGARRPPRGFTRADFRVPTLAAVLRAFPHTPVNIEIKGRTKAEARVEYLRNADALARELRRTRRRDLIVVSFEQQAVERFHRKVPQVAVAPGIDGAARFLLGGGSPGDGVAALQLPVTYTLNGEVLQVSTRDNVARAHHGGYAWHTWLSDDPDTPATWGALVQGACVDGVMTARPAAFHRWLRAHPGPRTCP